MTICFKKKNEHFRDFRGFEVFDLASSVVSPNKRHGSVLYWEDKFNQAMEIIDELQEKSIQLSKFLVSLAVQKVKPKPSKKNTCITQVHGSMKEEKVLDLLKEIENKKQQQAKSKEEATKKKEDAKQAFLKCKVKCVCEQEKCMVIGLKLCPMC